MSSCRAMKTLDLIPDGSSNSSGFIVVYVTCPTEQASALARVLITEKAAACVNIISNVRSIYRWQNKIEDDNESMLLIKTTTIALDQLSELVKQHHPYELPEIIATPIVAGLADYLSWIDASTEVSATDI